MVINMAKAPKKPSLVEELKSLPPSVNPLESLVGEDKQELDAVLDALKKGALAHLSLECLRHRVCERFNVKMAKTTFRDFLVRKGYSPRNVSRVVR